jgi:hypothetical protein
MKSKDITEGVHIWRSNDEEALLCRITEPTMIESLEERDRTIVEGLIRKNLLIKIQGKYSTYVYPAN